MEILVPVVLAFGFVGLLWFFSTFFGQITQMDLFDLLEEIEWDIRRMANAAMGSRGMSNKEWAEYESGKRRTVGW